MDDKRMQLIDSMETCAHRMRKGLVLKKEEIKCNNIRKQYKIFNFDYNTKEEIKEQDKN